MQEELKALVSLINSWQEENIELAFQILKGNRTFKQEVAALYGPILELIGKKFSKNNVLSIPVELGYAKFCNKEIPYSQELEAILLTIPITYLDYSYRNLEILPWWVCSLRKLSEINLSNNKLEALAEEIVNLTDLQFLNVNHNKLKTLPQNIGNLTRLEKLQLDYNDIAIIPDSLGELVNLEWLCLEANKIEKLPKTLENLKNIEWVSVENTPLGNKHKISYGMYMGVKDKRFKKLLG